MNDVAAYIVALGLFYFSLCIVFYVLDEGDYWRLQLQGRAAYRTGPWEILTTSFIVAVFAAMALALANFFLFLMTL